MKEQNNKRTFCTYGDIFDPWGIGEIIKESQHTCYIKYHENQHYPEELWDKNYVKKFENIYYAMNYYSERKKISMETILERTKTSFPSIFKKEKKK